MPRHLRIVATCIKVIRQVTHHESTDCPMTWLLDVALMAGQLSNPVDNMAMVSTTLTTTGVHTLVDLGNLVIPKPIVYVLL